jgi:hypothetical protein
VALGEVFRLPFSILALAAQTTNAQILSIAIAPPELPVYAQPAISESGYLWTLGYWAYGPDVLRVDGCSRPASGCCGTPQVRAARGNASALAALRSCAQRLETRCKIDGSNR